MPISERWYREINTRQEPFQPKVNAGPSLFRLVCQACNGFTYLRRRFARVGASHQRRLFGTAVTWNGQWNHWETWFTGCAPGTPSSPLNENSIRSPLVRMNWKAIFLVVRPQVWPRWMAAVGVILVLVGAAATVDASTLQIRFPVELTQVPPSAGNYRLDYWPPQVMTLFLFVCLFVFVLLCWKPEPLKT